jgi:hypothetical protein
MIEHCALLRSRSRSRGESHRRRVALCWQKAAALTQDGEDASAIPANSRAAARMAPNIQFILTRRLRAGRRDHPYLTKALECSDWRARTVRRLEWRKCHRGRTALAEQHDAATNRDRATNGASSGSTMTAVARWRSSPNRLPGTGRSGTRIGSTAISRRLVSAREGRFASPTAVRAILRPAAMLAPPLRLSPKWRRQRSDARCGVPRQPRGGVAR